jgi:Ca2+-binding RTX toxin-like protein
MPSGDGGTASAAEVQGAKTPGHGRGMHCGEIYVASTVPNSHPDLWGGRWVSVCTPIALDLDGDGIEFRSLDNAVLMDPNADGRWDYSAWIGPDDGLLLYDANGDGIGQHHEFVLTSFVDGAETDLDALRAFDSNRDGVIDAADTYYASFKIGRDLNQNGHFEAGEVQTLAQHGITAIYLNAGVQHVSDLHNPHEGPRGIYTFNTGQFQRANGTVGSFADVALLKTAYWQQVYSNGSTAVASLGSVHAWIQQSAAAVALNLATATYAGFGSFVNFYGNSGDDIVFGGGANNILVGGDGIDMLFGEGGDDTVIADYADFAYGAVSGGDGFDTLIYTSVQGLYLDASAASFEMIVGGAGNDTLFASSGTAGADGVKLLGHEGNDSLSGSIGNDYLVGGAGADYFHGGDGDDILVIDGSDAWTSVFGGFNVLRAGDTVMIDSSSGY